jgi:hypothetical protein
MSTTKQTVGASAQYKRVYSVANLELAWDRILRCDDQFHKAYWRDSIATANLARQSIIKRLSKDLRLRKFSPDHACIIPVPKKSGLLRHCSLISFGDQLVFQAVLNVIADQAYVKMRVRYLKSTFANRYGGPENKFFYRSWLAGYKQFNAACIKTWEGGRHWYGGYDFASFYDSIDHTSLRSMLLGYKVNDDVIDLLESLLIRWTSTSGKPGRFERRYLGHGIPQGPQPSALLAEIMLSYVDHWMLRLPDITYLRYADDIRIFGRTEQSVRLAAVNLDKLARNLGLFPQLGKFEIKEVEDVNTILKTISRPDSQADGDFPKSEEDEPVILLRQMLETGNLEDVTRLKWLINITPGDLQIGAKLAGLIVEHPELTDTFIRYLSRVKPLSDDILTPLFDILLTKQAYPWVSARILTLVLDRFSNLGAAHKKRFKEIVRGLLPKMKNDIDFYLSAETMRAAVLLELSNPAEVEKWINSTDTEWWSVARFLIYVNEDKYGKSALQGLLIRCLSCGNREIERAAAFRLSQLQSEMPNIQMHDDPKAILTNVGLRKKPPVGYSRISYFLNMLLFTAGVPSKSTTSGEINWKTLLGSNHDFIEAIFVRLVAFQAANSNAFIQELDIACDEIVKAIQILKNYQLPAHIRNSKNSPRGHLINNCPQFKADFPNLTRFCVEVNTLRNLSELSHLHSHSQGRKVKTGRISYAQRQNVLKELPGLIADLEGQFPA